MEYVQADVARRFPFGCGVPEHIQDGIIRYVDHGIPPGSFLRAVICNDLKEACACADDTNRRRLFEIVGWFYMHAPSGCWGSPEKMANWMRAHEENRQEADTDNAQDKGEA